MPSYVGIWLEHLLTGFLKLKRGGCYDHCGGNKNTSDQTMSQRNRCDTFK